LREPGQAAVARSAESLSCRTDRDRNGSFMEEYFVARVQKKDVGRRKVSQNPPYKCIRQSRRRDRAGKNAAPFRAGADVPKHGFQRGK